MPPRQNSREETKFISRRGRVVGNPEFVSPSSLLSASLIGQALVPAVKDHAAGTLLDVGCGTAPLEPWYGQLVDLVVRSDWSLGANGRRFVDVVADAATGLPFADESIDTIICSDVLEHVERPAVLAQELRRISTSDARLILSIPFMYPVHEAPFDFQRFTQFGLRSVLESNGWEVGTLEPVGGLGDVVADLVAKGLALVPVIGKPLSRVVALGAEVLGRTALGRKVRSATSGRFTLAYLVVARPVAVNP